MSWDAIDFDGCEKIFRQCRDGTGVACKFLLGGIDDVCVALFYGKPLTVTCAGLLLPLVLIVNLRCE